jgi:hypothetical protein
VSTFPLVIAAISGAIGVALCIFCAPVVFYLVKKGYLRFYHWGSSGFKKAEAPRVVPTLKEIGGFVTGERIRAARRLKEAEAEAIRVAREVLAEEEAELAAEAAVAEAEAAEQRRQDEELAAAARAAEEEMLARQAAADKMRRLAPARFELQRFMTELEERRVALAARREREAVRRQHRLDEAAARAAKKAEEARKADVRLRLLEEARIAVEVKIAEEQAEEAREQKRRARLLAREERRAEREAQRDRELAEQAEAAGRMAAAAAASQAADTLEAAEAAEAAEAKVAEAEAAEVEEAELAEAERRRRTTPWWEEREPAAEAPVVAAAEAAARSAIAATPVPGTEEAKQAFFAEPLQRALRSQLRDAAEHIAASGLGGLEALHALVAATQSEQLLAPPTVQRGDGEYASAAEMSRHRRVRARTPLAAASDGDLSSRTRTESEYSAPAARSSPHGWPALPAPAAGEVRIYVSLPLELVSAAGGYSSMLPLLVRTADSVAAVKRAVDVCLGVAPSRQRLSLQGRALDDGRSVRECGVRDGARLLLVLRQATRPPPASPLPPRRPPPRRAFGTVASRLSVSRGRMGRAAPPMGAIPDRFIYEAPSLLGAGEDSPYFA